jgi:putative selenium metabolism hydrolase
MEIAAEIKRLADAGRDETARTLSDIVQIPSLSGEEGPVIARLEQLCREAGFDRVRVDGLGNLVAEMGAGEHTLAIDAHIDTVDTGELSQWEDPPFSGLIRDGWVHGRGTVDQKGGAAAMIGAARILKQTGYSGPWRLVFTFTVMEEDCDGLCWKYLIEEEKLVPDLAVITEPTGCRLYRGHRGRMEIEGVFKGVSAHGSAPERGENAVYKAGEAVLQVCRLNEALRDDSFLGKGTVAVTQIASSSPSLCAIPDSCMFHLDRRLTWGETRESALEEVLEACGREVELIVPYYDRPSYRGTRFSQEKYFPTWKIDAGHPLCLAGIEACRLLFGEAPETGKWTFSTNGVAICGEHRIPAIGFGPGEESFAHAPNEKIPVDHLERASAFYALLPYCLPSPPGGGEAAGGGA